jgi:para-aminobenzoate synthetase component 1
LSTLSDRGFDAALDLRLAPLKLAHLAIRMRSIVHPVSTLHSPESLGRLLEREPGRVILRTARTGVHSARYSMVTARPLLTFRSHGSRCETLHANGEQECQFGDPWRLIAALLDRYELPDDADLPFPLGGVFGYFGYEMNQYLAPQLERLAVNDLELPDCHLGFHGSLVVFDHELGQVWIIATGLAPDGTRTEARALSEVAWWSERLQTPAPPSPAPPAPTTASVRSTLPRAFYQAAVRRAQAYIHTGDIYQVNLAQRFDLPVVAPDWSLFESLLRHSPAPFAAFVDCGDFALISSSPELFLRLSGDRVTTRPIKGTRPRGHDAESDRRLADELLASEKERAELVMITDLLRNDLGRVAKFGTVKVPDLLRLETFAQVQHLVSTVEATLPASLTHLDALSACFPGGSITGAPKLRAMQIIDELEPVARGPYCGCHGYLGFNRESQLSITIRSAILRQGHAWFHAGAGIVADSIPEAEFDETVAKASGLFAAFGVLPTGTSLA